MPDKFRTQDEPLTGLVPYSILLPVAAWYRREFLDALRDMLFEFNWEQVGAVTVYDATQCAETVYWSVTAMIGTILAYATADPPAACLACDGAQYLRTDYPQLYAALAPQFILDADNFIVPDLRGRTIIGTGAGVGLTERMINDDGGEESHSLSAAEGPVHSHSDTGHVHSIHSHIDLLAVSPGELPISSPNPFPESTSTGNAAIGNSGSGSAHNNMGPFLALNYGIVAA